MTIQPFELSDIEFDLAELEPADWEATAARIRWHLSTPYAVALKTIFGEALVSGMVLGIAHNGSGWLGDRLFHPAKRTDELYRFGLQAMCDALEQKGCATISALVAPHELSHFAALGFTPVGDYVKYSGGTTEAPTLDEVELFEPHMSMGVLHLDRLASGEDRRTLVSEHFYASRIFIKNGRVQGNYIVLLGEGLLIAQSAFVGEELLRWHLPHVSDIWVPEQNSAAVDFLQRRGYQENDRVTRMGRGPALDWRPEMIFGRIGANLG